MTEPGIGELIARVMREAVDLVSAEVARARAEIDERARFGAKLVFRTGLTLMFLSVALNALSVAAIVWSSSVFGGYLPGALVVGTVFLAMAGVIGLSVRRAAVMLADPAPSADKLAASPSSGAPALTSGTPAGKEQESS